MKDEVEKFNDRYKHVHGDGDGPPSPSPKLVSVGGDTSPGPARTMCRPAFGSLGANDHPLDVTKTLLPKKVMDLAEFEGNNELPEQKVQFKSSSDIVYA